jgi:urea transport system permease protein
MKTRSRPLVRLPLRPQLRPQLRSLLRLILPLLLMLFGSTGMAQIAPALLAPLAGDDPEARIGAVGQIAALGSKDAERVLQALKNDAVLADASGRVLLDLTQSGTPGSAFDPANGQTLALPAGFEAISVNNRLRGAVETALSGLKLFSPALKERQSAAVALQNNIDASHLPLLQRAQQQEADAAVKALLQNLIASVNLQSAEPKLRLAAVRDLAGSSNASLRPQLQRMLEKNPDGSHVEPDAAVRLAVVHTLNEINGRLQRSEWLGNLFYGVSLGSVLLLAALGLSITFGLMGIINMAHGEMLMIGAYTTWGCQMLFRHYFPGAIDAYLLLALPAAFVVTAAVGMLMERTVIRWLYGRPLETLLATWGISLMLMQTVRTLFGAQNVEVANPSWMSGGVTVLGSLVLPYNRIVIIGFAFLVVLLVWLLLTRTRLGLFVRAVTQNRRMADCVGVATGKVDMLTFGLGSGIAGLGGVALSQLGNVGPDLGQSYIIDSFMVVVLGGVGQLAGTVIAALGLGELSKLLEPAVGAVLAKILILMLIIIFIQRRPQGLFAMKGRSVE